MSRLIRASAITLAIFGNIGLASAQNTPGSGQAELNPTQQRMVSQGLASSQSQSAPASQPQVGDKVPDSMAAQSVPSAVSDQIPEVKNLLFVKFPDRILLIDPDTKLVHEIVMDSSSDSTTTGSTANSSARPSSTSSGKQ